MRNDSEEFGFGILAAGLSFAIENIEALIKTLISQFHYTIIIIITKEECGNHQQTLRQFRGLFVIQLNIYDGAFFTKQLMTKSR